MTSGSDTSRQYSGTLVAAIIVAAMLGGLAYRYWPNEERSIRRHLSNLAEALSLPYTDSEVASITRFAALREYFHPDVQIDVDGHVIATRDVLIRQLTQWPTPPGGVVVELSEVRVALADDRRTARVDLVASASSKSPGTLDTTVDTRAFTLAMTKATGDWVIARADGHRQN